jgi:hypothetical protein
MSEFRFNDEVKIQFVERFDEVRKDIQVQNALTTFNEKNIQSNQCIDILVNLIYLLNKGEKFNEDEKEKIFLVQLNYYIVQIQCYEE